MLIEEVVKDFRVNPLHREEQDSCYKLSDCFSQAVSIPYIGKNRFVVVENASVLVYQSLTQGRIVDIWEEDDVTKMYQSITQGRIENLSIMLLLIVCINPLHREEQLIAQAGGRVNEVSIPYIGKNRLCEELGLDPGKKGINPLHREEQPSSMKEWKEAVCINPLHREEQVILPTGYENMFSSYQSLTQGRIGKICEQLELDPGKRINPLHREEQVINGYEYFTTKDRINPLHREEQ